MKAKLFSISLVVMMLAVAIVPVAGAAPQSPVNDWLMLSSSVDDAPHPLGTMQRTARQEALEAQAHGSANGHIFKLKHGKYVELERGGGRLDMDCHCGFWSK